MSLVWIWIILFNILKILGFFDLIDADFEAL